jgi:2-oxoglutarate dehydrogenase E1 component
LVAGARGGKLLPDAYQGATITLTNPGTIGTVASVPRLMSGQGSIVATGIIRTVSEARLMTITSTYDHRIIQGAESGSFLQLIDRLLHGGDGFYDGIAATLALTLEAPASAPTPHQGQTKTAGPAAGIDGEMLYHVAAATSLVKAHRTHGYLAAHLDPLGTKPVGDPALNPEPLGLTPEIRARIPADVLRVYVPGQTLAEALPQLQETYCRTIAYELEHIAVHDERVWLRRVIESGEHRQALAPDEQRRLLDVLVKVEGLESFLHRAYLGHKRFGIEGLDALVPMLHWAIDAVAGQGTSVVLGMAHRGRLNVLTHVLGVSYETLLAEFEGGREVEETLAPKGGTGDVKYHHGATGTFRSVSGQEVALTLMPNPSHLEAVDPAVQGYARAVQTLRDVGAGTHRSEQCFPILVHGDAAFAGQGVVAETLNLTNLKGYDTGGTLHIIVNNQVGFTTAPREARSTDFASDLAKGFDVPIVHVNADDPEACVAAIRLAMMYRGRYGKDCVIDLVGYRRHGHNEGDEPRYTQPSMYRLIDDHPTVRQIYADRLIDAGVVTLDQVNAKTDAQYTLLLKTQKKLQEDVAGEDQGEEPVRTLHPDRVREPETRVSRDVLEELNHGLIVVPNEFTVHHKLKRQLDRRLAAIRFAPV